MWLGTPKGPKIEKIQSPFLGVPSWPALGLSLSLSISLSISISIYIYIHVCGTFRVYVSILGFFRVEQRKQLVLQCFEAASNV